jgi:hypothetical protein
LVKDTVMTRRIAAPRAPRSCNIPKNGSKSISNKLCCGFGNPAAAAAAAAALATPGGIYGVLLALESAILLKKNYYLKFVFNK